MKHLDLNDKTISNIKTEAPGQAMALSNQIADLLKERGAVNSNVNVFVLGFPKSDLLSQGLAEKGDEVFKAKSQENAVKVTKDGDGNVTKLLDNSVSSENAVLAKKMLLNKLQPTQFES